jgi:hypothetical protein
MHDHEHCKANRIAGSKADDLIDLATKAWHGPNGMVRANLNGLLVVAIAEWVLPALSIEPDKAPLCSYRMWNESGECVFIAAVEDVQIVRLR